MNRLQLLIAQIGPRQERQRTLQLILRDSDLPSVDWETNATRSWRTGIGRGTSERGRRAHSMKSFSARRFFVDKKTQRYINIGIVPFASASDALDDLDQIMARLIPNPYAKVMATEQRMVEDQVISGVDRQKVFEVITQGERGEGLSRFVVGCVDRFEFTINLSEMGDSTPWSEIVSLSNLQASRIREMISRTTAN